MTTVYTIGHSTRSLADFVALLHEWEVKLLVDIRSVPRSRHNPQFEGVGLAQALPPLGIDYLHLKALGGLRHARTDSPNLGWRNSSFRGYADYMQTPAFAAALAALLIEAEKRTTAIMCAEAVPWRCHRFLVADALVVAGVEVRHIMGPGSYRNHTLNPMAVVQGSTITYPAPLPAENERSPL